VLNKARIHVYGLPPLSGPGALNDMEILVNSDLVKCLTS
jgi:hypothetical protein